MNWWQDVLDRTSWLELIAAFFSIVAAVVVALAIQRRDFEKRAGESMLAEFARVDQVTLDRKRDVLSRALDVLAEAVEAAMNTIHNRQPTNAHLALPVRAANVAELIKAEGGEFNVRAGMRFAADIEEIRRYIDLNSLFTPNDKAEESMVDLEHEASNVRSRLISWFESEQVRH